MKENLRYNLELSILADALTCQHSFGELVTYLKPNNFICGGASLYNGKPLFRFLWECMSNMYPLQPISTLSVCIYIKKEHAYLLIKEVTEISNASLFTQFNRPYYCLELLENDLRNSFITLLSSLCSSITDHEMKLDLMYMEDYAKEHDVFDALDTTLGYFEKSQKYHEELGKIKEFKSKVGVRISELKRAATVKSLWHNINGLYSFSTHKKIVIGSIIDLLVVGLLSNSLTVEIEENLLNLRKLAYS